MTRIHLPGGAARVVLTCGALWYLAFARITQAQDPAEANSLCGSGGCQLLVGIGGTYHYWAATGGIVAPIAFDWGEGRYELGAFRITTSQMLEYHGNLPAYRFADPYWGFSLSRRWRVIGRGAVGVWLGFGASYKTETDDLDSTRLNFAEQLAIRWRISHAVGMELAIRHWSNAGIRLPNRGQDFATAMLVF